MIDFISRYVFSFFLYIYIGERGDNEKFSHRTHGVKFLFQPLVCLISLFVRPIFQQFYNLYVPLFIEFDENAHRDTAEKA